MIAEKCFITDEMGPIVLQYVFDMYHTCQCTLQQPIWPTNDPVESPNFNKYDPQGLAFSEKY